MAPTTTKAEDMIEPAADFALAVRTLLGTQIVDDEFPALREAADAAARRLDRGPVRAAAAPLLAAYREWRSISPFSPGMAWRDAAQRVSECLRAYEEIDGAVSALGEVRARSRTEQELLDFIKPESIQRAALEAATQALYADRNHVVALAAKMARELGYAAGVRADPKEPRWPVVYIELPTGQVSWHVRQDERETIFAWLGEHPTPWDGHDTEEKHRRIRAHRGGRDAQTARVLREVDRERERQTIKWGVQNHPTVDPDIIDMVETSGDSACGAYEIPTADAARDACEAAAHNGTCDWVRIAVEELCEAVEACARDEAGEGRKELVQLAAVCVAAVECIDRRRGGAQ